MGKLPNPNHKPGRLVWNHSTHIPGLISVLSRLAEQPDIKTITPGRIARIKSRPTSLRLKVTVPIVGGYKIQARVKSDVQEVFVVTDLSAAALQERVDALLG